MRCKAAFCQPPDAPGIFFLSLGVSRVLAPQFNHCFVPASVRHLMQLHPLYNLPLNLAQ